MGARLGAFARVHPHLRVLRIEAADAHEDADRTFVLTGGIAIERIAGRRSRARKRRSIAAWRLWTLRAGANRRRRTSGSLLRRNRRPLLGGQDNDKGARIQRA
jgi:hypothetical protein